MSRLPRHLLLAGLALTLAGCSSTAPRTTEPAYAASGSDTVVAVTNSSAGSILTDGDGRVLYARVPAGACDGECEARWQPYVADGVPRAANGALNPLRTALLQIGSGNQVTYAGHPLYRFSGDTGPGTVSGQGARAFGATWYPLNPNGDPVPAPAVRN